MKAPPIVLIGVLAGTALVLIPADFLRARYDADTARVISPEAGASPRFSDGRSNPFAAAGDARDNVDTVESVLVELRELGGGGPTAKGACDDSRLRLRALVTASNGADVARSLSPGDLQGPVGTAVLEAWLAADAAGASAWIAAQSGATDHHAALVAGELTRYPELLQAFRRRLNHSAWAEAFLEYSGRELLRDNPSAAVTLADSMPRGERRVRLLESIACDWMLREPDAARAWIGGIEESALRHRLVPIAAESCASVDPLGAFEWLLAESPPEAALEEPLQIIAGIWRHTASAETSVQLNRLVAIADRPAD